MSVDTLEQVAPVKQAYNFTGEDRCDQPRGFKRNDGRGIAVSEQAYHRWTKDSPNGEMEVLLCNHHNKEHQDFLVTNGWAVESHPYADTLGDPIDVNA